MGTFRSEFTRAKLEKAYDYLTSRDFLIELRSKEEAVNDIKIIGRGWTEEKSSGFIYDYLDVDTGYVHRNGTKKIMTFYRKKCKLFGGTLIEYGFKGGTSFNTLQTAMMYALNNERNFKNKNTAAIPIVI